MSLSELVSQVTSNFNEARNAYYDHYLGCWENGGIAEYMCRATVQTILDCVARELATERQLNLSLFGKFSVLDEASLQTGKGVHISFRPAPKLTRLIETTPTGKTAGVLKEVAEFVGVTQTFAKEILDEVQQEICATLVKKGEFTIQQLGTFLVTNGEVPSETVSSKVRFRSKPYLKNLLSTLTDRQVDKLVTARERKRSRRKKHAVSSGTLDRKRLARVRKLLSSREPENVAMAMMVLEQIALPDDYRAVYETSGLVERLLRSDSADVVDSVAKIVAGTKKESVRDEFWALIGLKGSSTELRREWISSTTVEEFLRDTRNQSITNFDCRYISKLSKVRLAGLNQLIQVDLSGSGTRTLRLENLPELASAVLSSCQQLWELSLSGLDNLKSLDLDGCAISSLPEEIGTLRSLRELNLSGNPLKALPDSIGQLSQLETLNLSGSSLKALPDSIGQLSQLETLNLDGSSLEALPDSIGQLSRLEALDLSGSSLKALPDSIGKLSRLTTLDLSGSSLVELPAGIGGLASLTKLDLSSTGIETLPTMVGQLKSLQTLVLPSNIKKVPREMGRLPALRELRFFGGGWSSDESTATRIILDLCRQLDVVGPRESVDSG